MVRELTRTQYRRLFGLGALVLGALLALFVVPLFVGAGWIEAGLRHQFPTLQTGGLGWRLLPSPSVRLTQFTLTRLAVTGRGDITFHLALVPLLTGRVEPTGMRFYDLALQYKAVTAPKLSGGFEWDKDRQSVTFALKLADGASAQGRLDGGDLDLEIGGLDLIGRPSRLPRHPAPVRLHAVVASAPGEVALNGLTLEVGTTRLTGQAQLALADMPRFDLRLSTPRLDLDSSVRSSPQQTGWDLPQAIASAHADEAIARLTLPASVFATLSLSAAEVAHHGQVFRDLETEMTLDEGELVLNRLDAVPPGGGRLRADATLATPAGTPILDGRMELSAQHPEAVVAWMGWRLGTQIPAISAEIEGTAVDGLAALRKLSLGTSALSVSGRADVDVSGDAVVIDQARLRLHGAGWDKTDIVAKASVAPDEHGTLGVTDLSIESGQTRITGRIGMITTLGHPSLSADLSGTHWVLDRLILPIGADAGANTAAPKPPPSANSHPKVAREPLPPRTAPTEPSGPLQANLPDLRLDLHPQSVMWDGRLFENPSAQLSLSQGTIVVDHFSARVWGGDLVGSGRLTLRGLPQISGTLSAGGLDMSQARLSAGPLRLGKGSFSGDGRCGSVGKTAADMKRHLDCTGQVRVNAGEIIGVNLAAINRAASQIANPIGILGLAKAGMQGGQTAFSAFTASAVLRNGQIATNDARLDADGGVVLLRGTYAPQAETIDGSAELRLADAQVPAVIVRVDGPINQPRATLDINALMHASANMADKQPGSAKGLLNGLIKSLSQP